MRFGIFIPQGWRHDLVEIDPKDHWATMKSLALAADAGPWESLWVYDHFHTVPEPTEEATHEAWTLMSAFGAVTDRIRLGQMCTCLGYRNPAYLAKVAATVDHVSGGRAEMGIGAGWYEHEWRAYGYGFPTAPERLRMLNEGHGTSPPFGAKASRSHPKTPWLRAHTASNHSHVASRLSTALGAVASTSGSSPSLVDAFRPMSVSIASVAK